MIEEVQQQMVCASSEEAHSGGTSLGSGRAEGYILEYTTVLVYIPVRELRKHWAGYIAGHLTRLCAEALRGPPPLAQSNLYMG